jgi:hypothetical protein
MLMRIARAIGKQPPRHPSGTFARACRDLIVDVDDCGFGACAADQLMQFAVLGAVV